LGVVYQKPKKVPGHFYFIFDDFGIEIVMENRKKRWVVEVCHFWFNNFRKLKVRYEKTTSSF